jgi:hypothetical protein
MSDYLSILTEDQRASLTEDQLQAIDRLSASAYNLSNDIIKFNLLLEKLFSDIEYCQHDSEYRPKKGLDQKIHSLIVEINNFLQTNPSFEKEVFLYPVSNYLLNQYIYAGDYYTSKNYAARGFYCVLKQDFYNYCQINDIKTPNKFIINPNKQKSERCDKKNFSAYIDHLRTSIIKLPICIEVSADTSDFDTPFYPFSGFTFVNTVDLAK